TSAYVSRKIAPHLPPRFRDVLCCNLDVVFFQQSLEAFQWFRRRAIFPQRFHEFQHRPLLVGRQLSQFFQHQLRNSHSRLRFYPTLFSALGKRQPHECSGGSSDPCCLPLLALEAALARGKRAYGLSQMGATDLFFLCFALRCHLCSPLATSSGVLLARHSSLATSSKPHD